MDMINPGGHRMRKINRKKVWLGGWFKVDWLAGWLAGWLVVWLVGWLVLWSG